MTKFIKGQQYLILDRQQCGLNTFPAGSTLLVTNVDVGFTNECRANVIGAGVTGMGFWLHDDWVKKGYVKLIHTPEAPEYTSTNMFTAMCLWEAMIEGRSSGSPEASAPYNNFCTNEGVCEARDRIAELAVLVDNAWDELPEEWREDGVCFDWELIPEVLLILLQDPMIRYSSWTQGQVSKTVHEVAERLHKGID